MAKVTVSDELSKKRFRLFLFLFKFAGGPLIPIKDNKLYSLYSMFMVSCGYLTATGLIIDMFMHLDDMEHFFENARALPTGLTALSIHFYLSFRKKYLVKAMEMTKIFTWDNMPLIDEETGYSTMTSLIPRIEHIFKKFTYVLLTFHTSYCILRLVATEGRVFTLNSYYFPMQTETPIYEIINFCQVLGVFMWVTTFNGFLGLYAILVAIASGQFEKLRLQLSDIKQHESSKTDDNVSKAEMFNSMQQKLNQCIRHHQEILKFIWELEDVLNPLLMQQFLIILFGMCCASFSLVVNLGNPLQMSQSIVAYLVLSSQLYGYCWFGNELTVQAEEVKQAAWQSGWVGTPVSFQKCLIFIIGAANKQFALTAGKFVSVSRETLESVFKETVSLLMFLLQMRDKEMNEAET